MSYAFDVMDRNQERWPESELHRSKESLRENARPSPIRAEALLVAEECFQKALAAARALGTLILELRAALSLE